MIQLLSVSKTYHSTTEASPILKSINLSISAGETVAIIGPSGSGKSTLLNVIGLLTPPTAGEVWLGGTNMTALPAKTLAHHRNRLVGFIFQHYGLLPDLTVAENVELPLIYAGVRRNRLPVVQAVLKKVGLSDLSDRSPSQLSGGQQQRVAIARALVTGAPIVLADEPTGALDSEMGSAILDHLFAMTSSDRTLVIVTHDATVAGRCGRIIHLRDGTVTKESLANVAHLG